MSTSGADLHKLLREQFGFDSFRPGQERIIRSLLCGRDVLAVLPTGAGKSLVFQLAAQLLPGVTLVVSPLLALMKDQADSVQSHGLEVGVLNSAQPAASSREQLEKVEQGEAKLLYVTPERFENQEFRARAAGMQVSLLVVDEAHCVSQWGYDFRPSYLALADAAAELGRPTLLALTATATPWIRRDIIERLGMRHPDVVVRGVDRPNLFFEVRGVRAEEEDYRVLRSLLTGPVEATAPDRGGSRASSSLALSAGPAPAKTAEDYPADLAGRLSSAMQGSGIVYTATTHAAQETAGWLREWGITADFYHGQRRKADRERVQDAFMAGELRVIAATNAFGLGVDKPDIRFVIHRDAPASIEEYYQEAGRAGRDGEFARCTLIFRPGDLSRSAFLSATARLTPDDVERAAAAFTGSAELHVEELAHAAELSKAKARRVVDLLREHGVVDTAAGRVRRTGEIEPARISLDAEESRREYERSRVRMMRGYAETWDCRRAYLLSYFGEESEAERCGMCNNDAAPRGAADSEDSVSERLAPGARVVHPEWGEGEITESSPETITVSFPGAGEKKLATVIVQEQGLLAVLCPAPTGAAAGTASACAVPYRVGDPVTHPEYGDGEVQRVTSESVTVLFEKAGYHTLDLERVREGGLLQVSTAREEGN